MKILYFLGCTEPLLKEFCEMYNVKKLIKEPTCFKNPLNPRSIDVILTNREGGGGGVSNVVEQLRPVYLITISLLLQF